MRIRMRLATLRLRHLRQLIHFTTLTRTGLRIRLLVRLIARTVMATGGPDGSGLADAAKALDVLATYAIELRAFDPLCDQFCMPVTSALAHLLIAREQAAGLAKGVGSLGGATRGDSFRKGLTWLRDHLRLPIDLDEALIDSAAPRHKTIPGAGTAKAGTFPFEAICQFEFIARLRPGEKLPDGNEPSPVTLHYARSWLAFGINNSLRVQDCEEIDKVPLDKYEPNTIIHAHVRQSKNTVDLDAFCPAEGFLGPYLW